MKKPNCGRVHEWHQAQKERKKENPLTWCWNCILPLTTSALKLASRISACVVALQCSRAGRLLHSSTGLGISCWCTWELSAGTGAWWQMRAAAAASCGCPRGWVSGCDTALSDLLPPAAFLFFSLFLFLFPQTCLFGMRLRLKLALDSVTYLMRSGDRATAVSIYLPSPSSGKRHDSSPGFNESQRPGKLISRCFRGG